ncbi:glycoside hydrolase family 3 N-terminal domain-containing protein [Flammeovirgaceae bacterium SG7u.111]|nr:glycoside hydrolase family 3 N-terminal domain-containing protein [Flammeovirgaceae bacterium SG7u.132]WPO38357.1 glycoside hydrolase family 3 N-terminal domain-containing protein [Flammeovirgaceae bacterium SG7u.111]
MLKTIKFILLAITLFGSSFSGIAQRKKIDPYKNSKLPIEERLDDLFARMTLEEKAMQVLCIWDQKAELILDEDGNFSLEKAAQNFPNGLGQIARPSEALERVQMQNRTPTQMAELTNEIQRYFVEKTRLGIPVVFHEEVLHGHAARKGTHFPVPIALASSWDTDLMERSFSVIAEEARSRGAQLALAPVLDVARDPRWGRFEETYGEDPFLVSEMGLAAVKGLQGTEEQIGSAKMMATLKHLAGHGQPEGGVNTAPANISERLLREVFLMPFEKAIKQGGAKSVMASYNEIDGIPSHINSWLLKDVLRNEWGFDGQVVADYGGISDLYRRHFVVKDSTEAAREALLAGVDIELPDMVDYPSLLKYAAQDSVIATALDTAVYRLLKNKFLLGLFDEPYVDVSSTEKIVGSEKNGKLALEAAQKSIVLLKNEMNLLPLNTSFYNTIAVIGPNAKSTLLGGYSDVPPYYVDLVEGLKNRLGNNGEVVFAEGCRITEPGSWYLDPVQLPSPKADEGRIEHAVTIAERSDLVILAIGGNELTSREAWSDTHLGDRTSIELVGKQLELFNKLKETGRPVVVVLFNGRPLDLSYLKENAQVLLECWYLGQETGNALADVLLGNVNPSGKLPCTFPKSTGLLPAFYNHKPTAKRPYLFDEHKPVYPFGFGLSYTDFSYKDLTVNPSVIGMNSKSLVSVTVTNTGDVRGDEIVQLYIRDMVSSVTRPVKELKGFQKVQLRPGQEKVVTFEVTPELLKFYNKDMENVLEPGRFKLMVGSSSEEYIEAYLNVVN